MVTAVAPAAPANPSDARASLPLPLSPLIGRETLLRRVRDALDRDGHPGGVRLLTLTGPGGVGKTRLALQVTADVARDRRIAPVFVDLAPITDPTLVPTAIALALGLQERGARPLLDAIKSWLQASPTLLLLDNCEHVLAAAPVVADLLRSCAPLTVLTTSRAPLRLSGELEIPVPPLALPPAERPLSPADLIGYGAVRLFVERARATGAELPLTRETAPAVAAICRRLDGLPLALELAATRTKALSPAALLARLDPTLPLLTGGPRDHPARLRAMADAIAWSYGLLTPEEQNLFRHLAVFVGGFTLESAEAVGGRGGRRGTEGDEDDALPPSSPSSPSVLDSIAALIDHSLVRRDPASEAEQRFVLLETIREFGLGRLAAHGEAEPVRAAHAHHFLTLAETVTSLLKGPEQGRWLDRLEAEHGNLRAALAWFAQEDDAEAALRLAVALIHFWLVRGHLSEGLAWCERLLAATRDRPVDPAVRCRALYGAATLAQVQRDLDRATELLEEALRWPQLAEDGRAMADVHNSLGTIAFERGDLDRAIGYYEAAIPHYQAIDHLQGAAGSRNNLAMIWRRRGELDRAASLYEQSLTEWRAGSHSHGIALAANNLGSIATGRGDLATAAAYHREGLATFRHIGDRLGLATSLEQVADLALAAGQPTEAIRLLAAAVAARAAIGFLAADDASNAETLAAARAALDPATAASAWESGSALSLERALDVAGRVIEAPDPAALGIAASPLDALSERESEVLRLLAAGRSDREIGEALFISHRTAARHVANIYRKLEVHSRAEAAASARLHGLV